MKVEFFIKSMIQNARVISKKLAGRVRELTSASYN